MAKPIQAKKISVNRKAVAAVTLAAALLLTAVFTWLGATGRDLDAQGLYKLLPWLPTKSDSAWQQALIPGSDLGATVRQTYAFALADGESLQDNAQKETAAILRSRLQDLGMMDATVENLSDGNLLVVLPKGADAVKLGTLLGTKGDFAFADPQGNVFLTGDRITSAGYNFSDQNRTSFALAFQFDEEGKRVFGEKTAELIGQSVSLMLDGSVLVSPSISQALTEGGVSIPGFEMEQARDYAVLMRNDPLPTAITLQDAVPGDPVLGKGVDSKLILSLAIIAALAALYFVFRYRLGGVLAAWMLLLQVVSSLFFAAVIGAGFTLLTLWAVCLSSLVLVFAVENLYSGVSRDISHGRAVKQSLKANYTARAHSSLDVYASLLLIFVILVIMDNGVIGSFARVFGISLLLGLVIMHALLRLLYNETIILFGDKAALYSGKTLTKEASV